MPQLLNKWLGSGFPVWRINSKFCKFWENPTICAVQFFGSTYQGWGFHSICLARPTGVHRQFLSRPTGIQCQFFARPRDFGGISILIKEKSVARPPPPPPISQAFSCPTHGTSHAFSCPTHVNSPFFRADPRTVRGGGGGTEKIEPRIMSEIKFFVLAYLNLLNFACPNSRDFSHLLIFANSNVYFFHGYLFSWITCFKYLTPFYFRAPRISALLIFIFPLLSENSPFNFRAPQTKGERSKVHNSFVFVHVWADFKRIHLASTNCHEFYLRNFSRVHIFKNAVSRKLTPQKKMLWKSWRHF